MVTTKIIIEKMNNMTAATTTEEAELTQAPEVAAPRPRAPVISMRDAAADETENENAPAEQNLIETATEHAESTDSEIATEPVTTCEPLEATEPVETSDVVEELQSVSVEMPVRRSERIAQGISRPERYMLLTKIQKAIQTLAMDKEQAKFEVIQKEIIQLFEELKAIAPVMKADVPKDAKVLRFFIFLVEKFLVNGEFDKIKAHLVANGAQQKRELYPNKSSLTASIDAIFTCLVLVAYIGNYQVAKVDVKGAYIQTEISGSPIYMRMDKKLMTLALTILPSLQSYVTPEGTLYTKLLKALYGCIQSGQLWYAKNSKVLRQEGYIRTPTDPCIFRKVNGLVLCILILYVDDILIFADDEEISRVEAFMKREFQWITVIKNNTQSYLGMNITVEKNLVMVDKNYFIQQLLTEFTGHNTSSERVF
jgi:hypothetical protein